MNSPTRLVASATVGYLLGTIPSADVAARLATGGDIDLHEAGTGNPGAANTANVLGKKWGFGVMVADIAKGAVAGVVGRRLAGAPGANAASSAAVIGHCLPLWNGGHGGKGVATSVGQVLATFPAHVPVDTALALGTAAVPGLRQRAFAATTVASAGWVAMSVLWWKRDLPNAWAPEPDVSLPIGATVSSGVIFWRFWRARKQVEAARVPPT